ncbi:MAG: hypothetical protein B1H11_07835 [Desulfobacteraceae bacterium 4484_190.1]|nr:MAG: hypothetical protein B1H11_07835 [Desulfobacteraceae bacterium 4484_190.1]
MGSRVQGFKGSRFHFYPRTASKMRIYGKKVIFGRSNLEVGAKLAITYGRLSGNSNFFKIKACSKNYRSHIVDISRIIF